MEIDKSKGLWAQNTDIEKYNIKYIDDLAYYLYVKDLDINFIYPQIGFKDYFQGSPEYYNKANIILRKEKINKLKNLMK